MIRTVLRNRNRAEKLEKRKREEELDRIKNETKYMAKLNEEMKLIDLVLSDSSVDKIRISIPEKYITMFTRSIYREEMSQYSIIQVDEMSFDIGRRLVNF